MDQMKIGAYLKELRKEKNLTQEQIAEKFGVSQRSVSRWENGYTMPDIRVLIELADYVSSLCRCATSKQGRKVMGRHKAPSHRPATLFFLSAVCGKRALLSAALPDGGSLDAGREPIYNKQRTLGNQYRLYNSSRESAKKGIEKREQTSLCAASGCADASESLCLRGIFRSVRG